MFELEAVGPRKKETGNQREKKRRKLRLSAQVRIRNDKLKCAKWMIAIGSYGNIYS